MRKRIICPLCITCLLLLTFNHSSEAQAQKWVFFGIRIEEKVKGCVNNPFTQQETTWVRLDEKYQKRNDSIRADLKVRFPKTYTSINNYFVSAGVQKAIALVEKSLACGAKSLTFYEGKDQASITSQAEKEKSMYKEILSYKQLYIINCAEVLKKLEKNKGGVVAAVNPISCKELVDYRDRKLIELWESKRKSLGKQYKLHSGNVRSYEAIRDSLLKDTKYATSDIQVLLLTTKLFANALEDALSIANPVVSSVKGGVTVVKAVTDDKFYKLIKAGNNAIDAAVADDAEKAIFKQAAKDLGAAMIGLTFFTNFAENVGNFQGYSDLKDEVKRKVKEIDDSIKNFNADFDKSVSGFEEINKYKNAIDSYLSKNCSMK